MLEIYTDGSFSECEKLGFLAFLINLNGIELTHHEGKISCTSINQTEIHAAQKAIEWISDWPGVNEEMNIILYTDSLGLVNKVEKYKKKPYVYKSQGKPFKNLLHKVQWTWIKSHGNNKHNNFVDRLCRNARKLCVQNEISSRQTF